MPTSLVAWNFTTAFCHRVGRVFFSSPGQGQCMRMHTFACACCRLVFVNSSRSLLQSRFSSFNAFLFLTSPALISTSLLLTCLITQLKTSLLFPLLDGAGHLWLFAVRSALCALVHQSCSQHAKIQPCGNSPHGGLRRAHCARVCGVGSFSWLAPWLCRVYSLVYYYTCNSFRYTMLDIICVCLNFFSLCASNFVFCGVYFMQNTKIVKIAKNIIRSLHRWSGDLASGPDCTHWPFPSPVILHTILEMFVRIEKFTSVTTWCHWWNFWMSSKVSSPQSWMKDRRGN